MMTLNKKVAIPLLFLLFTVASGGGWWLWQKKEPAREKVVQRESQERVFYTCSMHSEIIREKPGNCPICGMELIRKIESKTVDNTQNAAQKQQAEMLAKVSLSPTQRVMANVSTLEVTKSSLNKEINAVGTVQYDQSRQARVTAWIAGRIDKLNVNSVGVFVSKERPVAEIYSPDLVATQQEYLLAIRSRDQLKSSQFSTISMNGEDMVASAKQRLMLLGVRKGQIAELEKSGRPLMSIPVYSPFSGVVVEKMVQQGQYVTAGELLFNIADLSSVWVEIELYENELANIHSGQQVEIRARSLPDKVLTGRITFIYPFLDPKTRTVKARVGMANPGMNLKPDMFVNAVIKLPLASSIVVPLTAVMDTGKRQVVWVESSPGIFEPRDVTLGEKANDKVQILSGLKEGEKVAVSGSYLIDSESQLKGGTR